MTDVGLETKAERMARKRTHRVMKARGSARKRAHRFTKTPLGGVVVVLLFASAGAVIGGTVAEAAGSHALIGILGGVLFGAPTGWIIQ